jgi:hypothetical protein
MNETTRVQAQPSAPGRIADDRAAKILERAAALDAKRNSEIEIDQLREAAADAGISAEAFEQALREHAGVGSEPKKGRTNVDAAGLASRLGSADVAHYASLLRDVMGDGQLTVGDAVEWRGEDGLTVAVAPGASNVTAAVSAEGRLRSRLLGVILPALLPLVFFFAIGIEEEEALIAFMGALVTLAASVAGTVFVHRREKKAQRKETERIRRQLQRLLAAPE